jgi:hypothetical protein
MPSGVWELAVVATDWAGNEARSPSIVIGIDEDPPALPEPSTSSDTGGESSSSSSTTDPFASSSTEGADGTDTGDAPATSGGDGCGCRGAAAHESAWLFAALLFARRRRSLGSLVLATVACSNEPSGGQAGETTSGGEASASTTFTGTGASATDTGTTTAGESSGGSSSGEPCEPGTMGCTCTEAFACGEDLTCMLDTCVPCETGTFACPCHFTDGRREGTCDEGLHCFGGLCAAPQPCPYIEDGECDEPFPCLRGTDVFDCCPERFGVCEERSAGGSCPDGSDPMDCGAATEGSSSSDGSSTAGSSEGSSSTGDATGSTT